MISRRRPIPKSRDYPAESLRYRTILGGAVRVYPDGREICVNSKAGWIEYKRRVKLMWVRQGRRCCDCGKPLALGNATFEHQRRRGLGAAFRDDRAEINGAAHWICNVERG